MTDLVQQKRCQAHNQLPIANIILHPYALDQIVSIGLDGCINIWKVPHLSLQKKIKLQCSHITSILAYSSKQIQGFLVGLGNGNLLVFNEQFEHQATHKLHEDCISDIILTLNHIVTTSYDGKVLFLNKQNLKISHTLTLQQPILKGKYFENNLYLAAQSSYIVNSITMSVKQTKGYHYFQVANNKVFGCSDDKGLTCLSTNSNNYVPCEFIILYKRKMLIFSQNSIGVVTHLDKMSWFCKKYQNFDQGECIRGGLVIGNYLFIGGDYGVLYCFKDNENQE